MVCRSAGKSAECMSDHRTCCAPVLPTFPPVPGVSVRGSATILVNKPKAAENYSLLATVDLPPARRKWSGQW